MTVYRNRESGNEYAQDGRDVLVTFARLGTSQWLTFDSVAEAMRYAREHGTAPTVSPFVRRAQSGTLPASDRTAER